MDKQTPPLVCDPLCDKGECVLNVTSESGYCKCDPFFAGETCSDYECHKFCHNKASCYVAYDDELKESKLKVFTIFVIITIFFFNITIIPYMCY